MMRGVALALLVAASAAAQRPDPHGIAGRLFIVGGGRLGDEVVSSFVKLAGGKDGRLVVIPTASARADRDGAAARTVKLWRDRGLGEVSVLHTRSRERADEAEFTAPLATATAVWIGGGSQSRVLDAYGGTRTEKALHAVLARGGVIGGTSAGAAVMSPVMIARGKPHPELRRGFGFLPGAVVDQHFLKRERMPRLVNALKARPGHWGVGIDESTAVMVAGRRLRVVGESEAVILLPASSSRPVLEKRLASGDVEDFVGLHRAAIARSGPRHPRAKPVVPHVPKGTLIIAGGGRLGADIWKRFLDAAGGPEAPVVIVPTASAGTRPMRGSPHAARALEGAGAEDVAVLHAPRAAMIDEAWLKALGRARGVWFTGGRQWRLVDAYMETPAYQLFHDVLARGGVIGGSSAGATIQGDYLVRGSPLRNTIMMAEGYEKGFAFLPGVAIDQHFAQRNRFADMTSVARRFPQLLGLGLDESTAVVVRGSTMEVVGAHEVAVYDQGADLKDPDHRRLKSGQRYDLARRVVLE